jgi:hypothetical protein
MVYVNELRPGFVSVTISVLGKQTSVLQTEQVNDRFNYQAFPSQGQPQISLGNQLGACRPQRVLWQRVGMSQEEHFLSKECQEFNYYVARGGDFHLSEWSPDRSQKARRARLWLLWRAPIRAGQVWDLCGESRNALNPTSACGLGFYHGCCGQFN